MAIQISNMSFSYIKGRVILNNINMEIPDGQKVGIIGPNGVGKSTLLRLLTGLECDYEGEISVNSVAVNKKNLKELRRHIGYVFQDSDAQLFLTTVKDNVAFGPSNYGMNKEETKRAVLNALKKVGIENLIDSPVYMISGGEKKLAGISTVLSINPEILIFDEPSSALDPRNRRRLINVLNDIEKTMVITSHDLDFIYDTCERVILLSDALVKADGDREEILKDRNLLESCGLELPLSFSRR